MVCSPGKIVHSHDAAKLHRDIFHFKYMLCHLFFLLESELEVCEGFFAALEFLDHARNAEFVLSHDSFLVEENDKHDDY